MSTAVEFAISALIVVGAAFVLLGSIGLARLPDFLMRLHGPTKATTLGIGALLIASMLYFILEDEIVSLQELLITTFLFLTAPVTALMVAKAHILLDKNDQEHLPPTGREVGWSVLDAPQTDEVKKS